MAIISNINNAQKQIIVIRTNRWSYEIESWARFLKNNTFCKIVIAAEETKGEIAIPYDFEKVTLNYAVLQNLQLYISERTFWSCGDYFMLAVHERYPDANGYWLLDNDVRINFRDIQGFIDKCVLTNNDFICCSFGRRGNEWYWFRMIEWYSKEVYGCFFPMSYFSRKAAGLVAKKRRELTLRFFEENIPSNMVPNDEAFVATTVATSGLPCEDFNNIFPGCQLPQNYHLFSLPMSGREYRAIGADECLYHPVISGEHYVEKTFSLLDRICDAHQNIGELRKIFERIEENFRHEGRADDMARLEKQLNQILASREGK